MEDLLKWFIDKFKKLQTECQLRGQEGGLWEGEAAGRVLQT